MPGLIGFTAPHARVDANAAIRSLRDSLVRYDFHGEDELFSDGTVAASRIHNGAVPGDPQPVRDGEFHVWLDGEIFADGATDVRAGGAARLAAVFAGGAQQPALAALNGGFAACVYDRAARRVHLVSDRYGFRHLYYLVHDGALWWSSEIKSFASLPGFQGRICGPAVESFLRKGSMQGDETWLEGVELLPAGTVLTWDLERRTASRHVYWRYDDIAPVDPALAQTAMVDELGERFLAAVRRRCAAGHTGLLLSGGLDSRAVLAAIPRSVDPVHAVTFGQPGSFDLRWGRRAARVRGAIHHVEIIDERDWVTPRIAGVWWTDGQMNLLEMHSYGNFLQRRQWFDVNVSGFVGDLVLGGSYVRASGPSEREVMATRCRRFTAVGLRAPLVFYETRLPFTDNDLLDYAFGLPRAMRADGYIYHRMLLRFFPRYFRSIPWQTTGVPVNWPRGAAWLARRVIRRSDMAARAIERRTGLRVPLSRGLADYAAWLRHEPERARLEALLLDSRRHSGAYTDVDVADLWRRHLAGENHAGMLGRLITLEVWLRQLFDGELRPQGGHPA